MNTSTNQEGFTLVEITIAMAIFGAVLIVISVGLFGIIKIYRSSIAQRDTQINAHSAMNNMVRDIRKAKGIKTVTHTSGTVPNIVNLDEFCLDNGSDPGYHYVITGTELHRFESTYSADCDGSTDVPATIQTYTSNTVKVLEFKVTKYQAGLPLTDVGAVISLSVGSISGTITGKTCNTGPGSEFCSVTKLDTSVALRGGGL